MWSLLFYIKLPFKEKNAVMVSIYFSYQCWFVSTAVLVYRRMQGVQTWLNENPDRACISWRKGKAGILKIVVK